MNFYYQGSAHGWACAHLQRLTARLHRSRQEGCSIHSILRDGVLGAGAVLPAGDRASHFWAAPLADPRWTVANVRRWRAITVVHARHFLFPYSTPSDAYRIEMDRVLWEPKTLDTDLLMMDYGLGLLHVYARMPATTVLARYRTTTRSPHLVAERLSLWALVADVVRLRALRRLLAECPPGSWSPFTRRALAMGIQRTHATGASLAAYRTAAAMLPVEERLHLALRLCSSRYNPTMAASACALLESFEGRDLRAFALGSPEITTELGNVLGWVATDLIDDGRADYRTALLAVAGHLIDSEGICGRALVDRIDPDPLAGPSVSLFHAPVVGEFVAWLLARPNPRLREVGRRIIANGDLARSVRDELGNRP